MKIVHLIQYHLGGGGKRKGGKGGHTPTPQLPDAGKPYVDSISYDKNAKKVRLRAQNARAGEVKTPLGDWQEFPVDVPEPTPLPDAGKPFVEGVTYDPDTKKVKVRAKVAQAGEVKDPIGEEQEFPIHVPTPPVPPAPSLPDAGKPRVSKFDYDPTTRKVTVQASVSQAGEVKTPLGDEQTFDIPAESELPNAGEAYVDSCEYNHENRIVTVHARNQQAGVVKNPEGRTQEFSIPVPYIPQTSPPYIDKFEFDPHTGIVKARARNTQAGEVKDPIGEEQTFHTNMLSHLKGFIILYEFEVPPYFTGTISAGNGVSRIVNGNDYPSIMTFDTPNEGEPKRFYICSDLISFDGSGAVDSLPNPIESFRISTESLFTVLGRAISISSEGYIVLTVSGFF